MKLLLLLSPLLFGLGNDLPSEAQQPLDAVQASLDQQVAFHVTGMQKTKSGAT